MDPTKAKKLLRQEKQGHGDIGANEVHIFALYTYILTGSINWPQGQKKKKNPLSIKVLSLSVYPVSTAVIMQSQKCRARKAL